MMMALPLFSACENILDIENIRAINPNDVWTSADMANAYLTVRFWVKPRLVLIGKKIDTIWILEKCYYCVV